MSIQCYECPDHEGFEVLQRTLDVPFTVDCPQCGKKSTHAFAAPAIINVKRDWNEKANLYQRDPYTQSKAQLTNMNREATERGERQTKITEEAIQVGAKAIDERQRQPIRNPEVPYVAQARRVQRKAKKRV